MRNGSAVTAGTLGEAAGVVVAGREAGVLIGDVQPRPGGTGLGQGFMVG